ncbi:T9SS C-terminal target domain-containing protein [candidate division KSB1 bacterium]|nr:T9SS type A sorting domain-containing protein [candidate division KSB1 bacterium]RQW00697.1 MAG: T9SS C-terminal target domain-containing protein [candidate division KSB1 bacterium]
MVESDEINPVDVKHYNVDLFINMSTKTIDGHAQILLALTDSNATQFYLHLSTLTMADAFINNQKASYTRSSDKVYFEIDDHASEIIVEIDYAGTPGNDGFGGFFFQNNYAFTIGQGLYSQPPSMLRHWIPSHDVPFDKATIDLHLTVPKELDAFANGVLVSTTVENNTKTFFWREQHPIATYLIAVAVGQYAKLGMPFVSVTGDSISLEFYVFPNDVNNAQTDWANLPRMLTFFEQNFSSYPFDRYSMAQAYNRGAMEHQTMTTYSHELITGDNRYDYIVAHELAHHWWGDLVTLGDWKDIWLNEGFATYSEALYFEHIYGDDYLAKYMEALSEIYLAEVARRGHFALYDPEYMWGGTVYQKGAWVLHMLRWTIGEAAFWRTLQSWAQCYAYDNALIPDFIAIAEEQSGQNLQWFFDQWIYRAGYPDFDISWDYQKNSAVGYTVTIDIKQQQWDKFQFIAPVEIEIETATGTVVDTLISSSQQQQFQITLDTAPARLIIDPYNWLLKQYDIVGNPAPPGVRPNDFYLAQNYPNPFMQGTKTAIVYQVAQLNSPHALSIKIYNILGQEVATLIDRSLHGGLYNVSWDGKDNTGKNVPAGVYFYRLQSQKQNIEKKLVIFGN